METMTPTESLPEVIPLGHLTISIPTNDDHIAEECFRNISQRIKTEFFSRNRRLSFFYDLDIEVEEILPGSKRYKNKPKLRLKKRWSKLKKAGAFTSALLAGIAGYPAVSDGAQRIYHDFQAVVEHVIDDEQQKNPDMPPSIESCFPPEDGEHDHKA